MTPLPWWALAILIVLSAAFVLWLLGDTSRTERRLAEDELQARCEAAAEQTEMQLRADTITSLTHPRDDQP